MVGPEELHQFTGGEVENLPLIEPRRQHRGDAVNQGNAMGLTLGSLGVGLGFDEQAFALLEEPHFLDAKADVARHLIEQINDAVIVAIGAIVLDRKHPYNLAIAGDDRHARPRANRASGHDRMRRDAAPR